jgi:drug/metabolite transporter (DMT)-like permease
MSTATSQTIYSHPGRTFVFAALGLGILGVSFSSIFTVQLARDNVAPLAIAFYRMAMATALLAPPTLIVERSEILSLTRKEWQFLIIGGLFLAVHFGSWITSLNYIPIATSAVLVNSHPLFVVLAAWLFLGEKPTRLGIIGTIAGLIGMLIIGREGFTAEFALFGDTLAVIGALAVVGYFIIGRKVRVRLSLLGYVTPLYAACSFFLLIWALATQTTLFPFSVTDWIYFAALAIVPTILGHTVFNWAIKHVRPSTISVTFLGEPVIASILAFFFFRQQPSLATFIGGAFILCGVYLTIRSD